MPDPRHQFVVKGTNEHGVAVFYTGSLGGKYPELLRNRDHAYPMTEQGAVDVATRFNVCGLKGFTYSTEPYVLPA